MSHELRTPLNGIVGMLQLLLTTFLDSEQQGYVETAVQSSKRLTNLLSDILDLSKVEAGHMEVACKPFELDDTLLLVEQLFRPSCEQKGIVLATHMDANLPNSLQGDQARLLQILNNLVGNAVKFTDQGRIEVEAYPLPEAQEGKTRILFSVFDTGIGIEESRLYKLFQAFTQADESFTRKYQGAGLGLAIVKRLVSLMGGNIAVASQPGEGTCFHFCLTFAHDQSQAQPALQTTAVRRQAKEAVRILLAEDDTVNRLTVRRLLEKAGYDVHTVQDGSQALETLRSDTFDLVVMDIQMPVMDGVEATKAIRRGEAGAAHAAVPVLALTAYAMEGDKERFLAAGLDDYIAKPLDVELLQAKIASLAGSAEGRRGVE